jgi:hypothetical protein
MLLHQLNRIYHKNLAVTFKRAIDVNTPYDSEHLYLSSDGEILCRVRRYNMKDNAGNPVMDSHGKPKKEFRQFTDSPYPKIPDVRPLYNIPNIVLLRKLYGLRERSVLMHLMNWIYTATCTMGGAGMLSRKSASRFDFSPLQRQRTNHMGRQ